MGSFLVNLHTRTESPERVAELVRELGCHQGWVAGPQNGWVTLWEKRASEQNSAHIQNIAQHLSQELKTQVIAFLVHDSDVLCYWLYDMGRMQDEYNSRPDYWSDASVYEESFAANCSILVKYCRPGTEVDRLEEILKQWTHDDFANGGKSAPPSAEEQLRALAQLLGLKEQYPQVDYVDFETEMTASELGASWIGEGDPLQHDDELVEEDRLSSRCWNPSTPLYEAAMKGDIETIERLIAEGVDINEIPHGYTTTALAQAASSGTPGTVKRLIELGADIHKHGKEGRTPFFMAAQTNQWDNMRVLAEMGADPNEVHTQWGTLLHLAILMQSVGTVETLMELGADPEIKNSAGHSAREMIRLYQKNMKELVASLPKGREGILEETMGRLGAIELALFGERRDYGV